MSVIVTKKAVLTDGTPVVYKNVLSKKERMKYRSDSWNRQKCGKTKSKKSIPNDIIEYTLQEYVKTENVYNTIKEVRKQYPEQSKYSIEMLLYRYKNKPHEYYKEHEFGFISLY